jgi:PAS domain S-box-containing protein
MITEQEILNASILIVDDQQSNVILLAELLSDSGYTQVTSTMDPFAVYDLHCTHSYDLILLDLKMPGMDGFQVMEKLKKINEDDYLPIIVITAQPDHKLRALAAGAKDFIAKPFDLIEVQTRIRNILEVRLLHKKLENQNKLLELTVEKRTEELRASEARFRRLTELSSDWYWEQDENGHFVRIFGPVFDMLGVQPDDTQGCIRDDNGAIWNNEERRQLLHNLSARLPFLDFLYSRINSDGTRQHLMVSGEPMFDQSGRYTGYRGVGKDVTHSNLSKLR